jgi:HD-GYP domain-containing protein (c-di-GMP phosphodiesterase class II)
MRSPRSHRAAMSRSAALQEIDLSLGTYFDPVLGERFIGVIGRRYL